MRADRQTDTQGDILIAILCNRTGINNSLILFVQSKRRTFRPQFEPYHPYAVIDYWTPITTVRLQQKLRGATNIMPDRVN